MFLRVKAAGACVLAVVLYGAASHLFAQQPEKKPSSDLDAFMAKALARRDVNKKVLNDYILDETEEFEILGPARTRLHRSKREYTWYVRDGMHVRSPLRFEGVTVGEEARDSYEQRCGRGRRPLVGVLRNSPLPVEHRTLRCGSNSCSSLLQSPQWQRGVMHRTPRRARNARASRRKYSDRRSAIVETSRATSAGCETNSGRPSC